MADAKDPGQEFLRALAEYVRFRLSKEGASVPAEKVPPREGRFVEKFGLFLELHKVDPNSDVFKNLMEKMGAMKETRGPVGPKPGKRKEN